MPYANPRQCLVTLDVEGVLTPEIWVALADAFDIAALRRTTQHESNYRLLMQGRIDTLTQHEITVPQIRAVIAELRPLDGAKGFLDSLRREVQVVLLSDTFEQFIGPLMAQLSYPTILCHRLDISDSRIVGFEPRIEHQKQRAVEGFRAMNFAVVAAGDSYNDLHMLDAADRGLLFAAPESIRRERADLQALDSYAELTAAIRAACAELTSDH
ncbi:MAG: bifunctional phosphoserine phosphatase/homoserine phosphotransferase ThrH [Acidimicrobiales bacterium]